MTSHDNKIGLVGTDKSFFGEVKANFNCEILQFLRTKYTLAKDPREDDGSRVVK